MMEEQDSITERKVVEGLLQTGPFTQHLVDQVSFSWNLTSTSHVFKRSAFFSMPFMVQWVNDNKSIFDTNRNYARTTDSWEEVAHTLDNWTGQRDREGCSSESCHVPGTWSYCPFSPLPPWCWEQENCLRLGEWTLAWNLAFKSSRYSWIGIKCWPLEKWSEYYYLAYFPDMALSRTSNLSSWINALVLFSER